MDIINLTPHAVNINGVTYPASGAIARVSVTTVDAGTFSGIPLIRGTYGDVTGLPDYSADTLLIVSAMVRSALPHRKDLASPAKLIRDDAGNIIGCAALEIN